MTPIDSRVNYVVVVVAVVVVVVVNSPMAIISQKYRFKKGDKSKAQTTVLFL